MEKKGLAIILLMVSMLLFGCISICKRSLTDAGLSSFDVTFIRLFIATIALAAVMLVGRQSFGLNKKDIPFFVLFGIFKFLSDYTYFMALEITSVSLATVLQNTAPYFVLIISFFIFKDKVSRRTMLAMLVGTFGCALMCISTLSGTSLDPIGILFSLLSALFLGMFYIGSDMSLKRGYDAARYMLYMMGVATIVSVFFADVPRVVSSMSDMSVIINSLILGIFMTLVPFFITAWSVKYLGPLNVTVISVTEVVFATIVGVVYFQEPIAAQDIVGIFLMMISVVLIAMVPVDQLPEK